ncbi:hypothetical protein BP6252_08073 [Coleophoma cylindrospora]|uniref:Phosphoglycerate mutase-like protein n=1 Tax=Coleophoma cylindrospora TaxID=1849047 RepID=A0A3D8RC01_9HELO|nr:hypothetical protein BP6252_08073 [Coleophoma cylindrospora]
MNERTYPPVIVHFMRHGSTRGATDRDENGGKSISTLGKEDCQRFIETFKHYNHITDILSSDVFRCVSTSLECFDCLLQGNGEENTGMKVQVLNPRQPNFVRQARLLEDKYGEKHLDLEFLLNYELSKRSVLNALIWGQEPIGTMSARREVVFVSRGSVVTRLYPTLYDEAVSYAITAGGSFQKLTDASLAAMRSEQEAFFNPLIQL